MSTKITGFLDSDGGFGAKYEDIVILSGVRTPFGRFMGSLAYVKPSDLGAVAAKEAIKRAGIVPSDIDRTVFGNVYQSSADALFLPRHIALKSGVPKSKPASLVQRICASGFEAIIQGAEQISLGKANVVLCGGVDNMTMTPVASYGIRMGHPMGNPNFIDFLWDALLDTYCGCSMGQTAENLAKTYSISRKEVDEFACLSQMRTKDAISSGRLAEEIVPVISEGKIKVKNKEKSLKTDENPRFDTTVEKLSKLSPVFAKDGVQTAGNSSGIVDGAGALVVASKEWAEKKGLKPIGRLLASATGAVEPSHMGIGPVRAVEVLMKYTNFKLSDFDLFEFNEAFASVYIAIEKLLKIDREKTNVNGGAIAIGHPLAATGARLTMTILHELRRRKTKLGLAGACIGGGQGTVVVVENISN